MKNCQPEAFWLMLNGKIRKKYLDCSETDVEILQPNLQGVG